MATLGESNDPLKIIFLGDSGVGKTGALAALVTLGYELFILDFDNGTDILSFLIKDPEQRKRVHIETLTDAGRMMGSGVNAKIAKMNPQAFSRALGLLSKWVDSETKVDYGPVATWGTDRILVVDSLSFFGSAALDFILARNGRAMEQPWQSDWGEAMRMLEQALQILYSSEVKCNVIMNTHIEYVTVEGMTKGLPMGLGQKLPPKIGRYFNFMIMAKSRGTGDNTKRLILTKPEANIELKCPILELKRELPLETGLAEIFTKWNGGNLPAISQVPGVGYTPGSIQAQRVPVPLK